MSEEFIAHAISNIGVPTALCFYVLFVLNKSVNKLSDSLNDWSKLIEKRLKALEDRVDRLQPPD